MQIRRYRLSFAAFALLSKVLSAQVSGSPQVMIPALVEDVVRYQSEDLHHTSWAVRYKVHRLTGKEDSLRDLVESTDGNVAKTLERDGKRLSPEDLVAEDQRLRSLSTNELAKRHHNAESTDKFALELVGAMPKAMVYSLAPGQPQLPQLGSPQVVLDYVPNPEFHPASTAQSLLTGIAGRIWIDSETHHLLRIEINITKNLNLFLGILAHVYQGGSMVYEQHSVGSGHYAYSHIAIDVRLRELMVKTVPYRSTLDATDVTLLPSPPTLKQAVDLLLAAP